MDPVYVEDHCSALLKVFKNGKIGEFYNIGSNKNLNNLEICKALLNVSKKLVPIGNQTKIIFVKDRPGHDLRYALNSNKIIKKLKWTPKVKFNEGLKKTFLWYLKNNMYYKSISKSHIMKRLGNKK
jgi:dTDP-glucose 4,6-dehydratase